MSLKPDEQSSETVYRIDRKHWHCHLSNYVWPNPQVARAITEFQERWLGKEDPPPHLLFTGDPGLGKSHLAIALYRWAVYKTELSRCVYHEAKQLCKEVKSAFDGRTADPLVELERAKFVVLDDLFGTELTEWEMNNVVPVAINAAYRNSAALIVTSNYPLEKLQNRLMAHEMDRLMENCVTLVFSGESQRLGE